MPRDQAAPPQPRPNLAVEQLSGKICPQCKQFKPSEGFRTREKGTRLRSWCIKCTNDRRIERVYGLNPEEFNQLLRDQGYSCPICLDIFWKTPAVDHNHKTKERRGLLCKSCNIAIGLLEEDPENLVRAIEYLRKYS